MVFLFYIGCMNAVCINGTFKNFEEATIPVNNRSYRYGDGLFETIRIENGIMQLKEYHFKRLFDSMSLLQYKIPSSLTAERIEKQILELCDRNNCVEHAKVRLSVSRGNGNLNEATSELQYIIETSQLGRRLFNKTGLRTCLYLSAKKQQDSFCNLKSASFLPYVMGANFARQNNFDDCFITNSTGNIADSTIANVFIVKSNVIFTPSLCDGCVDGVMRKHLLKSLPVNGFNISEKSLSPSDLENADEIFLSNAIRGIQWVEKFGEKSFTNECSSAIYKQFFTTIVQ